MTRPASSIRRACTLVLLATLWALPLAAGLAGAASGYATHGNPQTVLQGLSLAHRAQLMPKLELLRQQQQQKMIHDLIMSGKLSPQALQRLGQQYPWAAPYTEAMLPTAQRQAKLQSFVEGQIPGFNGPPPAPVEAASAGTAPASGRRRNAGLGTPCPAPVAGTQRQRPGGRAAPPAGGGRGAARRPAAAVAPRTQRAPLLARAGCAAEAPGAGLEQSPCTVPGSPRGDRAAFYNGF